MTIYSVKQARQLAGKTQAETADHLEVHVQTYMKIERDPSKATIDQAVKLAQYFKRNIDEIAFFCPETLHNVES